MTDWLPRNFDVRWRAGREKLQARYSDVARLPDASRLAYLRGPLHVVTEEMIRDVWAVAAEKPAHTGTTANNVYIHVPFCKSICSFCNYERLRPSNPDLLEAWLKRVIRSMRTLAPAVESMTWGSVYIGGGTPSTLPAAMLDRLLEALHEHLHIHEKAQKSFEFDPLVMSAGRVDVLKRFGFSHFSFGIQATDTRVSQDHNRGPQSRKVIQKRFEELYAAGLYDVACDILLGLAGTTPESILADIEWLISEFKPKAVDVFQIAPTTEYVDSHFGGELEQFWSHLEPFQTVPEALLDICKRHRYSVNIEGGHRYTLTRDFTPEGFLAVKRSPFSYNQLVAEAGKPMHLIGFGPSARSQIFGHAAYQTRDPIEPVSMETPAVYEGHRIAIDEEIRSYLVHQLRDNDSIDRTKFRAIFGQDVLDAAPIPMSAWHSDGLLECDSRAVHLAPQGRRQRTESLLWLVPDVALEYEIARRQQLDTSPDGVLRLCGDLEPGTALAGRHTFGGVDDGRVIIRTPDRIRMRFRVAPGLEEGAPLRLVLESAPPKSEEPRQDLLRSMRQVRGVLRNNQV